MRWKWNVPARRAEESIYEAGLVRFRPIMMTTAAAMLGALPLALGTGVGSEIRRPLGIAIVGGLIVSQALTLYTTPVVYLYMDKFKDWVMAHLPGVRRPPSGKKKCRSSPTSAIYSLVYRREVPEFLQIKTNIALLGSDMGKRDAQGSSSGLGSSPESSGTRTRSCCGS